MNLKKIFKLIYIQFKLLIISLLILLAIGQIQLYFRTAVDSTLDVYVGFPYPYYFFSRDGNYLQGGKINNFIIDFILTFIFVTCVYNILKFIKKIMFKYGK
jgi:hypothetical protein